VRARRGYYPRQTQLSAAPQYNYEQVLQPAPVNTTPPSAGPSIGLQPQPATLRASAPATGPSYGSKNLNPDDDAAVDKSTARAPSANTERVRNDAAPPVTSEVARPPEPQPEARIEVAATVTPLPAPPAATPQPTPAPIPTPMPATEATAQKPPPQPVPSQPKSDAPKTTGAAQATPQPQAPISGGVLNARALKLPKPLFPETARRMRVSGTVNVEVTVDESGKVITARATSGHILLREAAVSAAREARFTPAVLHDKPVQVLGVIVYNFSQ
jgi:periplasmic protein TonB